MMEEKMRVDNFISLYYMIVFFDIHAHANLDMHDKSIGGD